MAARQRAQATVLLSGGLDSIACAHFLKERGVQVRALFFDYGQAAARHETKASTALAECLAMSIDVCTLSNSNRRGAGELTGRNAMLVFNALFVSRGATDLLALGLHAGSPYPDCSTRFVNSARSLVGELTDGQVSLVAPFIEWTKEDIFQYFLTTRLPLELTYSCERGCDPVCGACVSCLDRKALGC